MLKQKIFGLDISDHSIEAALLSKSFTNVAVAAYARTAFKDEVVVNGVIKKPAQLAEKIKKTLASAKPAPITTPYCLLSIPDSQIFTTVFKLPAGLKHDEIKNTIPYKAEEVIPFKSSDIYFDFKTITADKTTQEVFYAAAPKKVVDGYVEVLEAAGLIPVAFDLESISLARSLLLPKHDTKNPKDKKVAGAVLILDIGSRTTNVSIFERNGIRQNFAIKIAGNRFSKAVAQALSVAEQQASEAKIKIGFDGKAGQPRVAEALQKEAQKIIDEVKKMVAYYQEESGSQVISALLAGGSSLLPAAATFFTERLGIATSVGNPLRRVADPNKLTKFKTKAVLFANVMGLGLRGVDKNPVVADINLLPVRKRRFAIAPARSNKRAWRLVYIRGAVLLLLLAVLVGLIILHARGLDIYQRIFLQPNYNSYSEAVDPEAIDRIRTADATTTPESADANPAATTTEPTAPVPNVTILPTPAGYLNVRQGPGTNFSVVGRANNNAQFVLLEEQAGWYKIEFTAGQFGWVSAAYVDKSE